MEYTLIRSNRKTVSISINDDLLVLVKAPLLLDKDKINDFVESNEAWILKAIAQKKKVLEKYEQADTKELADKAKEYIPNRIKYYTDLMGLKPSSVKITSAKKRFGSCSGKNSVCFSYYLMLYPLEAVDYVIVHELAHIKYHNHSRDFYSLISKYMPDYKDREKLLKE